MRINITLDYGYTYADLDHAIEIAGRIYDQTGEIVEIEEADCLSIGSYDSGGWHFDSGWVRTVNEGRRKLIVSQG